MATRRWEENSFWHSEDHEEAEAILVITDDEGREITQVLTVRKFDTNGNPNPDFVELLEQVGVGFWLRWHRSVLFKVGGFLL